MNQEVLEFYNKNKDCVYTPPAIPNGLSTVDAARWLLNHPDFAWIELDIPFDLLTWKQEAAAVKDYYVAHRPTDGAGWESCCLHGDSITSTVESPDDVYKWTKLATLAPTITEFWRTTFPSETYKRVRFMKVAANGYIVPHNDLPEDEQGHDRLTGWPINLAIMQPNNCHFVLERFGIVPFEEGKVFLINIKHNHAVINFSNQDRIHMIGTSLFGNRAEDFAKLVIESYSK